MPASAPTISVLLPVHDAAATLGRAVASIRGQTAGDWELLAVDDGSTDGSGEQLASAAREDLRIRVLRREHGGIVAALNAGLAAARGGLIARMDADDEAHPDRLAEQAAYLAAHRDIGVAGSLVAYGGDRAANAGYARHVDWLNSLRTPEQLALNRFVESPFAHPSVMFRRELVARHGGYRAGEFPEDYELWLRWAEAGVRLGKVPRVLLTWHDPPGRLSRTDPRYAADAFYRVKAHYLARWLARERRGRRLLVWGAGRPTRKRAAHLEAEGCTIDGYVDIDPRKAGRRLAERTVIAPGELPPPGGTFVLGYVANLGARELIRGGLAARGYLEGRDFLMCA
ncbi:MAG TPA: glycosyltransferase [Opitutaceae bacterium]|nr:glycosyltransferase [Opitutaceae bacterium]